MSPYSAKISLCLFQPICGVPASFRNLSLFSWFFLLIQDSRYSLCWPLIGISGVFATRKSLLWKLLVKYGKRAQNFVQSHDQNALEFPADGRLMTSVESISLTFESAPSCLLHLDRSPHQYRLEFPADMGFYGLVQTVGSTWLYAGGCIFRQ